MTKRIVGKWRSRFLEKRLDRLFDEPRPGAPRRVSDARVEEVITKTLETTPRDATHWSTRSMAEAVGLSHTTIVVSGHSAEHFVISADAVEEG